MAAVDTFACDICGTQKQKANRWWKVYMVPGGVVILEWDAKEPMARTSEDVAHLCGENHTFEWVSKQLTKTV